MNPDVITAHGAVLLVALTWALCCCAPPPCDYRALGACVLRPDGVGPGVVELEDTTLLWLDAMDRDGALPEEDARAWLQHLNAYWHADAEGWEVCSDYAAGWDVHVQWRGGVCRGAWMHELGHYLMRAKGWAPDPRHERNAWWRAVVVADAKACREQR